MVIRVLAIAGGLYVAAASVAAAQVTSAVLLDRDLSVGAGATVSTTLGEAIARAQAAIVPDRIFAERGVPRRTANISYRLLKQLFLDAPQERLLLVLTHEVFGHGARLRELFDGPIGYRIGAPPPYGRGGGSTSFVFDREPAPREVLAIAIAGMEVNSIVGATVAHRAFSQQRMHAREAMRYLLFELDALLYIRSTGIRENPGHDVADYVRAYNGAAAEAGTPPVSRRQLRRDALAGLANPMLLFAIFSVGRYAWDGVPETPVPMLSMAGIRYLPMLRHRLTPYGSEFALSSGLAGRVRPMQIEIRLGPYAEAMPWGVSVRQHDVLAFRSWSADASFALWRQPHLFGADAVPTAAEQRVGVLVNARLQRILRPAWLEPHAFAAIVEIGFKTAGFVPGEPLRGGFVVRAGAGVPLGL